MLPPETEKYLSEIKNIEPYNITVRPDKELALFLFKKNKADYIYNVCALEGNPMTFPEIQTLLDGVTVGGHKIDDEQQVLNQNKSVGLLFSMLQNREFKLNKETFCKLNYVVSSGESIKPGEFRTGQVTIGGTDFIPPKAGELDELLDKGIKEISKIENPIVRSFAFFGFGSKHQFFWDGNKRTSRLMANGVLLENGYPALNIKAKDGLEFNKTMIEFYNSGNYNVLLTYLLPYYEKSINLEK
ncbi:MAG: Fic family protein [Deltaproteobacteria bacterium]|nr:Fic family protein [Deltaproteobacteria bacterium]